MEIIIAASPKAIASIVADAIEDLLTEHAGTVLGLATGSSPLSVYQELIRRHRDNGLSFAKSRAFLLDEYLGLPRAHPQSYHSVIRSEFVDHIDIDPTHVYSPDGEAADPVVEGQRYDAAIAAAGGIELQLLGIGTDGHIGFNEPTSSLRSRTRVKTLTEQTRSDNARFFDHVDQVPRHVMTQGLGTISEARHLVLVATGEAKAEAVAAMVEGPVAAICPGSVLQLHQHATVLVDEDAASRLKLADYYRHVYANKPRWQGI
ncbi:glucosamine-6-phosphate deaminase [Saxibacter everestensis]|uniref:Glucosamine-6-phosphate deaminase n=1 Tax=Saxibacter everestensis TaxID=2909229 RepID=A0ABY8QPC0_9MICO|nr:glucosamine-6-phosphate deaminase [Brevibacteriaceae bacterium ZFBP1038]